MMKYRRADDERWWNPRRRPLPKNQPFEVKTRAGEIYPHAWREYDRVGVLFARWPLKISEIAGWRYQPPPTFNFPGDPPGSWTCPPELYAGGPEEADAR